jgi:hypothetical protein
MVHTKPTNWQDVEARVRRVRWAQQTSTAMVYAIRVEKYCGMSAEGRNSLIRKNVRY